MGSGGGSKAEGIDLTGFLGRTKTDRLLEELIDTCDEPPEEYLRERFESRFEDLRRKTENSSRLKKLPSKEKLWEKLLDVFKSGFRCPYCGERMMIKDPQNPHMHSFSIDHKVSQDRGGGNSLDNLQFICHGCNMMKGVASHERFGDLAENNRDLIKKLKREGWHGYLANKLDRKEARA